MKFDVEKTVAYWLEGAEYDMGVAEALFQTEKYPYALFMGHLVLEKTLKAIVVRNTREHAPITHSLPLLVEKPGIVVHEEVLLRLREFMEFYFQGRYPEDRQAFFRKCTQNYSEMKLNEIKETFEWLKNQL